MRALLLAATVLMPVAAFAVPPPGPVTPGSIGAVPANGGTMTGPLTVKGVTSVLPQGLTSGQYGVAVGAPYSGAPVAGLGVYTPSGWSADLADFCLPGATALSSCVRVDSAGDLFGPSYSISGVPGGYSAINGTLSVVSLNVNGGEAHYANGTYTDPQGGILRAVKISGNGLAVSGGENVTGGLTADAITVNGGITETATATPASATAACTAGARTHDASYEYFCVAANTWKRVALSSW